MQKLLIADSNEEFRLALAEALQAHYHVLCCQTGTEALSMLCREQPEILVLEIMLPELDGLTVLERAVAQGIRPMVLASDSLLSDYVVTTAQRLGIGYLMRRPCDIHAATARILDLTAPLNPPKWEPLAIISQKLMELRISPKRKGYPCLQNGILLLSRDPRQPITKELYPAVAKLCHCSKNDVEHNSRTALEAAWKKRDPVVWEQYFPGFTHCPSNAVFLARLAEELRLELE